MEEIVPPRQSVVRLFFVVVSAKNFFCIFVVSKILAGNSPAEPPTRGIAASNINDDKIR
jgi:hypothetical protein